MANTDQIPVHTKNLIEWLRDRQESLERNTSLDRLNAFRCIHERGYNDGINALITFIETRYNNTYKDD